MPLYKLIVTNICSPKGVFLIRGGFLLGGEIIYVYIYIYIYIARYVYFFRVYGILSTCILNVSYQ